MCFKFQCLHAQFKFHQQVVAIDESLEEADKVTMSAEGNIFDEDE